MTRASSTPPAPASAALNDVHFSYGSFPVLFGVTFEVRAGEILGLLGTNGAGKSTVLRLLSGLNRPSGGRLLVDGTDVSSLSAEHLVALGVALVPGGRALFPDLDVIENLEVGAWTLRRDRRLRSERIEEALAIFPALRDRAHQAAGSLSGGEQQELAIAKALLIHPRLLCIDELSLGLAPAIVESLLETIHGIRSRGTTLVLVEQSINVAVAACERALFLEKGTVRFEGTPAELLERGDLARSVFVRH